MDDLRPLSRHAVAELYRIARKPVPRQEVNPGVVDRLMREALVVIVQMASPYKIHRRSRAIDHLQITEAGRKRIGQS